MWSGLPWHRIWLLRVETASIGVRVTDSTGAVHDLSVTSLRQLSRSSAHGDVRASGHVARGLDLLQALHGGGSAGGALEVHWGNCVLRGYRGRHGCGLEGNASVRSLVSVYRMLHINLGCSVCPLGRSLVGGRHHGHRTWVVSGIVLHGSGHGLVHIVWVTLNGGIHFVDCTHAVEIGALMRIHWLHRLVRLQRIDCDHGCVGTRCDIRAVIFLFEPHSRIELIGH